MSKTNVVKNAEKILEELLKQKGINVQKIILFGSYAKGKEKRDSDIDIIVVSDDFRNKTIFERVEQTCGIGRELVRRTKKPFDIIYYSDREWEEGNSVIINEAKEEGLVIHG
jgi:uncharacterized protein